MIRRLTITLLALCLVGCLFAKEEYIGLGSPGESTKGYKYATYSKSAKNKKTAKKNTKKIGDFDTYFELGQKEFRKKKYKKAIKYYKKALTIKQNAYACYNIGVSYYNRGKYNDAILYFRSCINQKPSRKDMDDASNMIAKCQREQQLRSERRAQNAAAIFGALAGATSAATQPYYVSQYNNIPSYNIPSYNIPSYNILSYNSPINYNPPPMFDSQKAAQDATAWITAEMEADKQKFLAQYRKNFKANFGREPSEKEEMDAYTQHLQDLNRAFEASGNSYQPNTTSSFDSSDSSDYNNSSSSGSSKNSSRLCLSCCGSGDCSQCHGSGCRTDNLYGTGTDYSHKCGICGGNGKCHKCGGAGRIIK